MNDNILSKNLRNRMHALGIRSAAELARRSGLGPSLIGYYLSGRAKLPSLVKLQPLAAALQTTPEALLAGSATAHPKEVTHPDRLTAAIADLDSPARAVLEQMLDECLSKVRRNQNLSNDDVASIIQTLHNLTER